GIRIALCPSMTLRIPHSLRMLAALHHVPPLQAFDTGFRQGETTSGAPLGGLLCCLAIRRDAPLACGVEVLLAHWKFVAIAPVFAARRRHFQMEPMAVSQPVSIGFRLGVLDSGVSERLAGH